MLKQSLFPQLFKGIALFTPGGDLIYSIDPSKQGHWHLHLCASLQEILGLLEPPHFLVPGYTATIDRWIDPRTQQIRTSAEISWPIQYHQTLLNTVFDTGELTWQVTPWQEESCDPIVLETYRTQFPQLWEDHDLIVRFERSEQVSHSYAYGERYKASFLTPSTSRLANARFNRKEAISLERCSLRDLPEHGSEPLNSKVGELTTLNVINVNPQDALTSTPISSGNATPPDETEASKLTTATPNAEGASLLPENATRTLTPIENASLQGASSPTPTQASTKLRSDSEKIETHSQALNAHGYVLRLFVSGHSAATEQTLKSLHQFLEHSLRYPYTLKVIDVFKHPELAEADQISATPTLLRVWPQPVRRIVGDLNNVEQVLRILATPEA